MALRSISTRRLVRPVLGVAVAGVALLGFAGAASADSSVSNVTAGSCVDGTTNRNVTLTYTSNATFTTAFKIYVVSGTPTGPVVDTLQRSTPPLTTTVTFQLPGGTYYFDWEDFDGGGLPSGRHSALSDFYEGVYLATRTVVGECVIATTTTAAATTTTTAATTTTAVTTTTPATTTAPSTTVAVGTPTTQAAATTTAPSTTVAVNVPTTAVVQTTAAASANTLPATGANNTPMIAAGVAFLGLGSVAVLSTRRRRPAHEV